jgi:hypothetical protein
MAGQDAETAFFFDVESEFDIVQRMLQGIKEEETRSTLALDQ